MRKAVMLTVIVVASIVAACGDGGEAETTPTPSEQPTATAEASLTVTPSPGPMGTPTPRPLTLEDADQYFDVTAVLPPDFIRVDPVAEGFEHPQEPGYSDMVMYKSQSRTQLEFIHMFMFLASGETEKTMQRLMLENDELLAYAFNVNFTDEGMEVNSEFQEVDVGDMAKMACCIVIEDGEEFLHADWLVFIQDEGPQAAVVSLYSAHTPWAVSTVDLVTVAEEISNNIANR